MAKAICVIGGRPADAEQFRQRTQLMIEQYSAFNPIDDLKLQGALGLGENIADLRWFNRGLPRISELTGNGKASTSD